MKKAIKRTSALVAVLVMILSFPFAAFAGSASDVESEAQENYEAAKDNLSNIYYNALEDLNSEDSLLTQDRP